MKYKMNECKHELTKSGLNLFDEVGVGFSSRVCG